MTLFVVTIIVMLLAELVVGLVVAWEHLSGWLSERQTRQVWRTRLQAEDELRRVSQTGRRAMYDAVQRHQRGGW